MTSKSFLWRSVQPESERSRLAQQPSKSFLFADSSTRAWKEWLGPAAFKVFPSAMNMWFWVSREHRCSSGEKTFRAPKSMLFQCCFGTETRNRRPKLCKKPKTMALAWRMCTSERKRRNFSGSKKFFPAPRHRETRAPPHHAPRNRTPSIGGPRNIQETRQATAPRHRGSKARTKERFYVI